MKVSRERYQHGSVRKGPSSQGFAWEFRFYLTTPDGKRKLKVQTFDSLKYPTERDVRKAVDGQLSALNAGKLGGKLVATPAGTSGITRATRTVLSGESGHGGRFV